MTKNSQQRTCNTKSYLSNQSHVTNCWVTAFSHSTN